MIHLVRTAGVPILRQLRLEEALLRADARNVVLINEGSPPSIVLGISGKTEQLLHEPNVAADGVSLVRRCARLDECMCMSSKRVRRRARKRMHVGSHKRRAHTHMRTHTHACTPACIYAHA